MAYIKGYLKQIIYKTEKGYVVGLFKVVDTDELTNYLNKSITFTGTFHDIKMDVDYILYGEFTEHIKYGYQFNVSTYEQIMPETKNGVISFLSSKLFPGVGIKLATKIVETLGDDALEQIIEDYHNLLIVPSMTEKKAMKIQYILKRESESYKIIVYLQDLGFSMNEASKIYKYYKEGTMNVINDNIYSLSNDIDGIGFLTVDKIAAKLEYQDDDERRIKACILYIMTDLCMTNGNTYNDIEDIYLGVTSYLRIDFTIDDFSFYMLKLNKENRVIIDKEKYYLKSYYEAENYIVNYITNLIKEENNNYGDIDKHIKKLESDYKLKYNDKQKLAIKQSFMKDFLIITGGPGTGKTTIIKAIVGLYARLNKIDEKKLDEHISMLAPTGRAAKRMMETTGISAMTIHKFLKWNKESDSFGINEYNKAETKFVIVDEVSMIDHFLMYNLFKGLPSNIKIIFVGDHHQLPSVGPGEILKDLILTDKIPVIELNDLYRQKEDSYIVTLAHNINKGIMPDEYDEKHDDYNFIETRKDNISNMILQLCEKAIEKGYSYNEIQVLIPMYKGINGIDNINLMLQDVFNPKNLKDKTFTHNNVEYRIGDKVLQIKNNNDLNVSNGDIGIIENIILNDDEYSIFIDFNDELIEYKSKDFEDIRLGYAISIHKSQGSEFDIVILPMDLSYSRMLYRKLLYTAVTRAKKSLIIVGEKEAFKKAIVNERELKRKTSLTEHLTITLEE